MNCTVGVMVNATKLKLVVKQIPSDEGRELLSIATRCSENRMASNALDQIFMDEDSACETDD